MEKLSLRNILKVQQIKQTLSLYAVYSLFVLFSLSLFCISNPLFASQACYIKTGNIILSTSQLVPLNIYIKDTNCPLKAQTEWIKLVRAATSKLSNYNISKMITTFKITQNPDVIKIIKIKKLLSNHSDKFFKNIKLINKQNKLYFKKGTSFNLSCFHCQPGKRNFVINVISKYNKIISRILGTTHIYVAKKAFVANRDINLNNSQLSLKIFNNKIILTDKPSKIFTSKEEIPFLSIHNSIEKGAPLLKNNVSYSQLVRAYTPINLIIRNGNISLNTLAEALESGHLGQFVKIKIKKSNKILLGKIINFNLAITKL